MLLRILVALLLSCNLVQADTVAIIGGGAAGLTTAWLTEGEHDVTIYEVQDRLGGHADTVQFSVGDNTYAVDAGFEFFSTAMFPTYMKLLSILDVTVHSFPLTYTFFKPDGSELVVLPPIVNGKVDWESIRPTSLVDLVQFKLAIDQGKKIVEENDLSLTLEQFASHACLTADFCNDFFYPYLAAAWGVKVDDIKTFVAYDPLKWLVSNEPSNINAVYWNEVADGTISYIESLANQLTNTTIKLSATISDITYSNGSYTITLQDGSIASFDHLVIATNASEARPLLENISTAQDARSILGLVQYYKTTIALHGDTRYMPPHHSSWSVANIMCEEEGPSMTVYKSWKSDLSQPIFRTWITREVESPTPVPLPSPLYATCEYYHPMLNGRYFQAQAAINAVQGNNNLWFAGMQTYDIDSHESAIISAMRVAENLSPNSSRLQLLLGS